MDSLPDLVLCQIFKHLTVFERVTKISLVCKRWRSLLNTPLESLMSDFHGDVCPVLLRAQLATFKVLMKGTDIECFEDILCAIQSLNANERQLIDLVVTLCKLIHVNPATSASGERSFSTARRVKTWLRSQMTQGRFNHLSILNTHKERLDEISLVSVANAFVSLNDNRKRNMGVFTDADFKI